MGCILGGEETVWLIHWKTKTYKDVNLGIFTYYEYSNGTFFYESQRFNKGNYSFIIYVFVSKRRDLKKCIKEIKKIIEDIESLDKLAQKEFMDKLKDDKFKFWKITLRAICYHKENNFAFEYNVSNYEEGIGHTLCVDFSKDKIIINTSFTGDD